MKIALADFPPMLVIFGRMLFASSVFLLVRRRLGSFSAALGDWKLFVLMALFEPCLYFIFESYALLYTSASQAGTVTSLLPLMVAVSAGWFLGEKTTPKSYTGFLIAISGVVMLSLNGESSETSPNPMLGNFLEFMAMICAAGYTLTAKKLSDRHSTWLITAVQAWIGAVFFFPSIFYWPGYTMESFPWSSFAAVVYLGLGVSILAYGLYNYSLKFIEASQVSAYINLIPVFSLLMGWGILGETLNPLQLVAIIVVFAGVLISQEELSRLWSKRKKEVVESRI